MTPGKIATISEFYGEACWKFADQTMIGKIGVDEGAKQMVREFDGVLERAEYKQMNPH